MKLVSTYDAHGNKQHTLDGQPATQEEVDAAIPNHSIEEIAAVQTQEPTTWPMACVGAGVCTRKQALKEIERARKAGVSIEFTDEATPRAIFTSRAHRKEYLKFRHLRDQDGGYGDHT
jgi:hypothetical protein